MASARTDDDQNRWKGYSRQLDACKDGSSSANRDVPRASRLWTQSVNGATIRSSGLACSGITLLNDTQAAITALVNLPTMLLSKAAPLSGCWCSSQRRRWQTVPPVKCDER